MINRFAVIGIGQFGFSIARSLANRGAEVMAIDIDMEKVEQIKDLVAYAVALDSTDERALRSQGVQNMDAVVVAIGEDFEALLLTTVILLEMQVKRLIARAANPHQRMILQKVGVREILSPEDEVCRTVAEMLINPNIRSFLPLPDEYEIVEINTPRRVANRTVSEIGIRERYNLNLITIKRNYEEHHQGEVINVQHVVGVPRGDTVLYDSDILIVLGKTRDVDRFVEVNN
jgi:trk system potassium uptake protein